MRAKTKRIAIALLLACLSPCSQGLSQAVQADLTSVALNDLMNIEVTSVSKKEQKLSRTASAVFVITQDDIRRSGATNLPDLLRMVPGMDVARMNSNTWAISARGFNGQVANKLLVMIDGRSVYSPMFSGVFWEALDVPLENLERIEVIRGPGATVWGANAVNGVINIITRKAADAGSVLVESGAGTYDRGFGSGRLRGSIGKSLAYRVSVGGLNDSKLPAVAGQEIDDSWHLIHAGFRADAAVSTRDSLSIQGDSHTGHSGGAAGLLLPVDKVTKLPIVLNNSFSGWDVSGRWDRALSPRSETSLQMYFNRDMRAETIYGFGMNTFDADFQHHVALGARHDVVWGLGYRRASDNTNPTVRIVSDPVSATKDIFSSFLQDEISLAPDRVYLSLGTKFEHNGYTGFGFEPGVRISWTASDRTMFWAAASSADRLPSRTDTGVRVDYAGAPIDGIPVLLPLAGNPKYRNEVLRAIEAGYRTQFSSRISLDTSTFFNRYHNLASVEHGAPVLQVTSQSALIVIPATLGNLQYGEEHGLEIAFNWKAANRWTLSPAYSFLEPHFHPSPLSNDTTTAAMTEGTSPRHQAQLRSHFDLPSRWGWNVSAYFVGRLAAQQLPSYTRVDSNLIWQAGEGVSFIVAGQNLLRNEHLEYTGSTSLVASTVVKRSAYAKITWQF